MKSLTMGTFIIGPFPSRESTAVKAVAENMRGEGKETILLM